MPTRETHPHLVRRRQQSPTAASPAGILTLFALNIKTAGPYARGCSSFTSLIPSLAVFLWLPHYVIVTGPWCHRAQVRTWSRCQPRGEWHLVSGVNPCFRRLPIPCPQRCRFYFWPDVMCVWSCCNRSCTSSTAGGGSCIEYNKPSVEPCGVQWL